MRVKDEQWAPNISARPLVLLRLYPCAAAPKDALKKKAEVSCSVHTPLERRPALLLYYSLASDTCVAATLRRGT